jgi:hypothetical protein
MKTKTMIIGAAGLVFGILGYAGKQIDMLGPNELLIVGVGLVIFGFLLPTTLSTNKTVNIPQIKQLNWLGFLGLTAILFGTSLIILKYWVVAKALLLIGGICTSLYFALISGKIKNLQA